MPSLFNINYKIFANGKSSDNWKWAAVLAVPVTEEEKEKYPIPNKEGEYYKWRMDMSTMKEFEEMLTLKFNKNLFSSNLNNIFFPITSEHLLKNGNNKIGYATFLNLH